MGGGCTHAPTRQILLNQANDSPGRPAGCVVEPTSSDFARSDTGMLGDEVPEHISLVDCFVSSSFARFEPLPNTAENLHARPSFFFYASWLGPVGSLLFAAKLPLGAAPSGGMGVAGRVCFQVAASAWCFGRCSHYGVLCVYHVTGW